MAGPGRPNNGTSRVHGNAANYCRRRHDALPRAAPCEQTRDARAAGMDLGDADPPVVKVTARR